MSVPILLSVDQLVDCEPLFVYGTGTAGRAFADLLRDTFPSVGFDFLDTFANGECVGKSVHRFSDFLESSNGRETIVIASGFREEILTVLKPHRFAAVYDAAVLVDGWRRLRLRVRLADTAAP